MLKVLAAALLASGLSSAAIWQQYNPGQVNPSEDNRPTAVKVVKQSEVNPPEDNMPTSVKVEKQSMEKFDISKYKKYDYIKVTDLDEAIAQGYILEDNNGVFAPALGLDWKDNANVDSEKPSTLTLVVVAKL